MSEEEEIPSLADLQKLRVVDLKKELQRLGLSQSNYCFLDLFGRASSNFLIIVKFLFCTFFSCCL